MRRIFVMLFFSLLAAVGVRAQLDITSKYITNATFSNGTNGWTVKNFSTPQNGNNTVGWATESYAGWSNLDVKEYSLTQKITLPKGNYRLANYSFFRYGLKATTDNTKSLAFLKAGDKKIAIRTLGSITAGGYANSQAEGANCFDSKMYRNVLEFSVAADNTTIEIGLQGTFDLMQSWVIAGMFELFDMDELPTYETPTDVTYLIQNSGFEYRDLTGWTSDPAEWQKQDNAEFAGKAGAYYAERWAKDGGIDNLTLSQTLTNLSAGYYTLTATCYYGGIGAIIFAGGNESAITPDSKDEYAVSVKVEEGGSLPIGIKVQSGNANWICVDQFKLSYYPLNIASLKKSYLALKKEGEELLKSEMYNSDRVSLQNAVNIVVEENEDSYISAIDALKLAIGYAKESVERYLYETAFNDNPADFTSKIKNPSYEDGENGWNKAQNHTGTGSMGVVAEDENYFVQSTYNTHMRHETIYQEGIELKAGTYRLSALLKGTPKDDQSTFIYATDGAVAHWEAPVFKGNVWCGYLKQISGEEWSRVYVSFKLEETTTLRIGALSWGNNYAGGEGGAFAVDDWKLELIGYPEVPCVLGDANGNGKASIRDLVLLVDALNRNKANTLYDGADANLDSKIDVQDVAALASAITAGEEKLGHGPESYDLTVYTQQDATENYDGSMYMLQQTMNTNPYSLSSLNHVLTKLNITVAAGCTSLSILAKGHENIAGYLHYDVATGKCTTSAGTAAEGYAATMQSDVISVDDSPRNGVYVAYMLPVQLTEGITVTVCRDGKYYAQDFNDLSCGAGKEVNLNFTNNDTPTGAWMATIPGNIHFNHLTLPGAHDAGTQDLNVLAKCQTYTIEELLNKGVRALDLRPYGTSSSTADNLTLHHGSYDTGIKFKDALGTVTTYLDENPSETVFILLHNESGQKDSDAGSWKTAVLSCLTDVKDYVKVINNDMLLTDCRGKMVIIARDNVGDTDLTGKCGWGGSFADKTVFYGSDTRSASPWTLVYQDEYTKTKTEERIADVEKLVTNYIQTNAYAQNRIFFNTLNTSAGISKPTDYAKSVNEAFYSSTKILGWDGRLGIVSGDFMGDSSYSGDTLLNMIIQQNYRYVYKGQSRVGE